MIYYEAGKIMKNRNIAEVLKQYRKLNKLSVADVSERLSSNSHFVAEKTIYGWESGQSQPDADTLMNLCGIYGINDVLPAFGYDDSKKPSLHLTEFEEQLILKYRRNPEMQEAVKKLLDMN